MREPLKTAPTINSTLHMYESHSIVPVNIADQQPYIILAKTHNIRPQPPQTHTPLPLQYPSSHSHTGYHLPSPYILISTSRTQASDTPPCKVETRKEKSRELLLPQAPRGRSCIPGPNAKEPLTTRKKKWRNRTSDSRRLHTLLQQKEGKQKRPIEKAKKGQWHNRLPPSPPVSASPQKPSRRRNGRAGDPRAPKP